MNDKTAIVTGGSRGLGRGLARLLVRDGWLVVADGRDRQALEHGLPPGAVGVAGDVTDPRHRDALVETMMRVGGRLDLLINNASTLGATPLPTLAEYPLDALRRVYESNVVAPLGLIQSTLPLLRASGGAIVNITSDAAVEPYERWGGYGSSKAALEQLSRIVAAEEPAVAVWWLDPGDMRTQMHQEAFPGEDISDRPDPESVAPAVLRLLEQRPPSGRIRAEDLLTRVST